MSLARKRTWVIRTAVVMGLLAYVGLVAMAWLSITEGRVHVQANTGVRFPGFWSDSGLLVMLAVAAPFVIIAAVKSWRNPTRN